MQGTLTGLILDLTTHEGDLYVKLAGITDNGKRGVTWIHSVKFSGPRVPAQVPAIGTPVMVDCVATREVFTVRGQQASRVRIHGKSVVVMTRPVETAQHGKVLFLKGATNRFVFDAHLVQGALTKPTKAGKVVEARLAVKDKRGTLHYFKSEAWRDAGEVLGRMRSGGEGTFECILRRDKVGEKAFDVMEVMGVTPRSRPAQAAPAQVRTQVQAAPVRELAAVGR